MDCGTQDQRNLNRVYWFFAGLTLTDRPKTVDLLGDETNQFGLPAPPSS